MARRLNLLAHTAHVRVVRLELSADTRRVWRLARRGRSPQLVREALHAAQRALELAIVRRL